MAGGAITYSVTIDPSPVKIAKILKGLGKEFKTWKPAFERMAPHFARGIMENVNTRGKSLQSAGSSSAAWGDINQKYQRRKERRGMGSAELHVTGKLLEQATDMSRSNLSTTATSLRIGLSLPDLPYAVAQQWGRRGGKKGGGNQPRRFMGFNNNMKAVSIREMNDYADILMQRAAKKLQPKGGA